MTNKENGLLPEETKALWSLYIAADEMRRSIKDSRNLNPEVWVIDSIDQQLDKWEKVIENSFEYVREDRPQPQSVEGDCHYPSNNFINDVAEEIYHSVKHDISNVEKLKTVINAVYAHGYGSLPHPKQEPSTIDVEALKKVFPPYNDTVEARLRFDGWNSCIDYLASAGYLRAPLEKVEGLEEAMDRIFPMQLVSGDAMRRTNPHSKTMLNSTEKWAVTKNVSCSGQKLSQLLLDIEHACRAYLKASEDV